MKDYESDSYFLHEHLGASCPVHVLWELAHEQGIRISREVNTFAQFSDRFVKDKGYFDKYPMTQSIQSSPFAIEKAVFEAFKHFKINFNAEYLELRFNPMLRNGHDRRFDLDVVIQRACDGFQAAKNMYDIDGGLIISTDRKFTITQGEILANKTIDFADKGVIGFDVSGTGPIDPMKYEKMYTKLKDHGMLTTFHAGEGLTTDHLIELEQAVTHLPLDRIGHGISCIKSEELMDMIRSNNMHLELCPMSNIKLKVLGDPEELKGQTYRSLILETLEHHEVEYSINMDGWLFLDCDPKSNMKSIDMDLHAIYEE